MTVTLHTSQSAPTTSSADALVIGVFQTPDGPRAAPGSADIAQALVVGNTDLTGLLTALGATGRLEEVAKIATAGRIAAPLVVAVGLGTEDGLDAERLRRAAGAAVRDLVAAHSAFRPKQGGASRPAQADAAQADAAAPQSRVVILALPAESAGQAEAVALGAMLGGYSFRRYRATPAVDIELVLHTADTDGADRGRVLATAMTLVRDLINTPPADLVPAGLAEAATTVAQASKLSVQVLDENELAKEGYGGILAVGMGSVHPPRLVRLEYTHAEATKTVVFAGKGITFDSGGLSLKPSKSMETMKSDMGGAAAVLGALQAVAALALPVNVIGYLCIAENMPGGGAQRPSDVITIYGGKTVEVLNTDAEGRLVLADALVRSGADGPDLVVDVATLTGAQTVALGLRTGGVMGSSDAVAAAITATAKRAGEAMWPMPMPEELRRNLDSPVADIANVASDRAGGMLVAAHFLREFAPPGVAWAHLDIAGPAYNDGGPFGYTPKGGTGAAVRTLVQVAQDMASGDLAVGE